MYLKKKKKHLAESVCVNCGQLPQGSRAQGCGWSERVWTPWVLLLPDGG